ncbi:MAG: hypothetical protein PHS59_13270 [Paludibacter sp.]|nr:hypothetical protein [Paludibacter sp.]
MQLKHLRNSSIDYEKWNECISKSFNSLTYAYSWFLDVVSPGWEALVSENYEYVMPLPAKSKYKIPYLVQPVLTQQLGIFSPNEINEEIVINFIKEIPYYSYELNLNEKNFYSKAFIYPNYILDLNQPYKNLQNSFSKNTKRNIDKAKKLKLVVKKDISLNDFLEFYYGIDKKFLYVQKAILENVIQTGYTNNSVSLYGVYSAQNELIASLFILHSLNRLTYLLPVSNAEGKNSSAMFYLIDYLIKKEANKNICFDFEGSRIEGIARFYRGFGAKNHPYYILKRFRPSFLIGR